MAILYLLMVGASEMHPALEGKVSA
jgi:hypothetical protein